MQRALSPFSLISQPRGHYNANRNMCTHADSVATRGRDWGGVRVRGIYVVCLIVRVSLCYSQLFQPTMGDNLLPAAYCRLQNRRSLELRTKRIMRSVFFPKPSTSTRQRGRTYCSFVFTGGWYEHGKAPRALFWVLVFWLISVEPPLELQPCFRSKLIILEITVRLYYHIDFHRGRPR